MAVAAMKPRNAVESLREIVQDLLVPELKAIKVELEGLRNEMRSSNDAIRTEMRSSNEALRTEMRLLHEQQKQATDNLADKIGYDMDVRERLAVLEDRAKRS